MYCTAASKQTTWYRYWSTGETVLWGLHWIYTEIATSGRQHQAGIHAECGSSNFAEDGKHCWAKGSHAALHTEGCSAGSVSEGRSLGLGSSSKPEEERGRALRSCSPSYTYTSSKHVISVRAYLPKCVTTKVCHQACKESTVAWSGSDALPLWLLNCYKCL